MKHINDSWILQYVKNMYQILAPSMCSYSIYTSTWSITIFLTFPNILFDRNILIQMTEEDLLTTTISA